MTGCTDDAFLGGRLKVLQPKRGYRAGIDPVLLAASVPAVDGQTVLELGCGTGIVLLCIGARVPGLQMIGVERNQEYAELARENCARNGIPAEIVEADVRALPRELKERRFDHVVANPPYFDRRHGLAGGDAAREAAIAGDAALAEWVRSGLRRVAPGGRFGMIVPADRLPEVLAETGGRGVVVRPIAARAGRDAGRVLVGVSVGVRASFRLLAPMILHDGASHATDADDFSVEARKILRDGQALDCNLKEINSEPHYRRK